MHDSPDSPQSKGGIKRAESLSSEQKSSIARQAAVARWKRANAPIDPNRIPEASYQGVLEIGDVKIDCYNLDDGRRVIHKRGMAKALGLKSEGGNAFMKTMTRQRLGSALGEKVTEQINNPIIFKPIAGDPGHGYEATQLIDICDAIVQARHDGNLAPQQEFLAIQAEIIIRASAKVGITALVDEATGYIADKRKEEYRQLFKDFIRDECRQWEQEFPDQFFEMLYRLYKLKRKNPRSMQHPRFFGHLIRKYIYRPLANSNGAILEELDGKNPVVYVAGRRKYRFFQFLTDEIGLPAFRQHLWQVIGIGSSVDTIVAFDKAFSRAFPQANMQGELFPDPT
jgi:hypothetical protein